MNVNKSFVETRNGLPVVPGLLGHICLAIVPHCTFVQYGTINPTTTQSFRLASATQSLSRAKPRHIAVACRLYAFLVP